ncbi:hypothetical protein VTK73DRAFT_6471 [Phialemonium thermophilum]|uniref:Amino acid transporter transmembrane domain-containing protein n=1 Tax=Phialemonium thermophilum TaxID=223376 RepID=A0ABR3WJJ2_9PEZI
MSTPGRESPSLKPASIPRSSSPGSVRTGRAFGSSVPRAESTARLASPVVPSYLNSTPPFRPSVPKEQGDGGPDPAVSPLPLGGTSTAGPGVSALAAALSNSLGSSPPRLGTPAVRPSTPSSTGVQPPPSVTPTNYGSFETRSRNWPGGGASGGYEDPEIVKRHLVQPSDTASEDFGGRKSGDPKGKKPADSGSTSLLDDGFSSLKLQGGDITRPIYKWTEEVEARNRNQRSRSFVMPRPEAETDVLDIHAIKVPGGFRRNFLRRAARDSSSHPEADGEGRRSPQPRLFTSSFLEFLTIYGHFAGEELEEDDEVLKPGEYFSSGEDEGYTSGEGSSEEDREPMEDSALLTPSRRRRKRRARGGSGKNSPTNAALLLLKSFVGTGVLFLPRAYLNGGMLFSVLVLFFVAALSYYCFVLLVTTRLRVEGSFGDIGGILYGKWLRNLILASIVLSQIGFVAAYIVFTSENLQAFILAVSDCKTVIDIKWLIVMQMVVFLPFSLLRDIGKLGFTALVADAFIVVGLAYLFYYDVITLHTQGLSDIILFNQKDWTLFIGTAIFTFEGIGLIIPIQESMRHPEKFPRVMFLVMIIITTLFVTMGAVSYAAYGSKTETVVLLNLPQDNRFVNAVQFLYSVAILLSTPLQIFPAIRILENALFTKSGKYNPYIKWQKNIFRFFIVVACAAIAWGGADNLDKFVALVGNFACIPLVYIYPPMLHYKGVARNAFWKTSDIVLCIFGFVAMAYTTSLTIMSWASSDGGGLPSYCDKKGL